MLQPKEDMRLPPAIRVDHDPFALAPVEIPGTPRRGYPLAILGILRWTSYACPHCHGVVRRDFWPYNIRLGNPERICKRCGRPFDDGSREWPELQLSQKLRFFLPPGILATAGGLLFCAIFTLLIAPRDVVNVLTSVVVVSAFLSPIFLWCLVRLLWVFRSKNRFENDPSSSRWKLDGHGSD